MLSVLTMPSKNYTWPRNHWAPGIEDSNRSIVRRQANYARSLNPRFIYRSQEPILALCAICWGSNVLFTRKYINQRRKSLHLPPPSLFHPKFSPFIERGSQGFFSYLFFFLGAVFRKILDLLTHRKGDWYNQ